MEEGADVEATDRGGQTPLMAAVASGQEQVSGRKADDGGKKVRTRAGGWEKS